MNTHANPIPQPAPQGPIEAVLGQIQQLVGTTGATAERDGDHIIIRRLVEPNDISDKMMKLAKIHHFQMKPLRCNEVVEGGTTTIHDMIVSFT